MENSAKSSKAVPVLTFVVVLLLIVLAGLTYVYYQQKQNAKETETQLLAEKDSISQNLLNLMTDYKELETDNDSLNQKLVREQQNAKKLYDELQSTKRISYAKIKEYQKELGTLRSIMKDMLHDIDSLNAMNKELIAENIKVKEEAATAKQTVKELEQKTEELNTQVAKGSVVKARDVVAMGVSRKGNEMTRARRVEKIRACFTLNENTIAKAGNRFVYMRIVGPDDYVLAKAETDVFDFEGEKIVFSANREVDYQNKDIEMCIYYDNNGELLKGTYKVTLYMDGYMIGYSEFTLK
jgi:ubiquitin